MQTNNLHKKKIAIIVANFYPEIADNLLQAAKETLEQHNITNYKIYYAPGAYEVPFMAKQLIANYDGIITLGAVIRGETPHFDYVCTQCASGIMNVSLEANKPISFGILTTENMEQTIGRAGGYKGNKGQEATIALIDSLAFMDEIK